MSTTPPDLEAIIDHLQRTPATLRAWLAGVNDIDAAHGQAWSIRQLLAHFIFGELTDWLPRADLILAGNENAVFEPFDHVSQFAVGEGRNLEELLDHFERLRRANIAKLRGYGLAPGDYGRSALHPELGRVTLAELLATWVVHDQNHLAHLAELIAAPFADGVGPWKAYLPLLSRSG